jgi:DNA-binding transcriptional regulator YiaG
MSTGLSFKAALERRSATEESAPVNSASETVRLLLAAGSIERPVDVVRLLAGHGLSVKKARAMLDRLAEGKAVAVELTTDAPDATRAELARLGVRASVIGMPQVDVKSVRQEQGLSQSEFAMLYGLDEDTLKNWEQGRNVPDGPARVLLGVIKSCPSAVIDALTIHALNSGK